MSQLAPNAIVFGWKRSISGREKVSAEHFQDFMGYLGGLQKSGRITSFAPVFLQPHGGGSLAGFFLVQGDPSKLAGLTAEPAWVEHSTRALLHLEDHCVLTAHVGEAVMGLMEIWTKLIR